MSVEPREPDDGWSAPSIFGRSLVFEPRLHTEADPIPSALFLDERPDDQQQWSPTNYFGPRRHRPTISAAEAIARASAAPAVEYETGYLDGVATDTPATHPAEAADALAEDGGWAEAPEVVPGPEPARDEKALLSHSKTMALASLVSRVSGFLRSSMLVAALGVAGVGDAYNAANNFPNMVYELLLGGVLSSVLVPLLVQAQEDDEDGGVAYTQRLLSIATAALGVLTLLAVLAAPLIATAFVSDPSQRSLTTVLATLLLPEIFFYGLGAMFMAVLNIRHSYGPGAWSPVLNNVIMIVTIGVFWLTPGPTTLNPATMTTAQILVLGIGTSLGIAAQALVLIPALRAVGFHWQWRFRAHPNEIGRMRQVGQLAFWVLGYVVVSQIGVSVIQWFGVKHRSFTIFTQADLLIQMPYGILVVSLLTALMPRLSRAAARGETESVVADLSLGARLSAVALLPITAGLIVLGEALSVLLFAYGQTSISGARTIGTALAASAFGLFPFAMVMLQLRVFYAMRDGRTPTLINAFMVVTKLVVLAILDATTGTGHGPGHFAVELTVSTSASYVMGAVIGHVALTRRLGPLGFAPVAGTVARMGLASIVGAAVAWAVLHACTSGLGDAHGGSIVGLLAGSIAGLVVMFAVAWQLRVPELRQLRATLGR